MTVEYIRYKIEETQRGAFINAYAEASRQLDGSAYCIAYELCECEEEAGQFIVRIEWTSTDEHLNGFRKSPEFREFYNYVKPFFQSILEMRHYQPTAVVKIK